MRRLFALLAFVTSVAVIGVPAGAASNPPIQTVPCSQWLRLIDVSSNNGAVAWATVAKAGIAGAYIKTTEGTWYSNPLAPSQEAGAVKAGLPFGNYDYAQPGKDNPALDARYFVAHSNPHASFPPVLDLEVTATSPAATWAWAVAWLHEVDALTHRTAIVYTGAYYAFSQSHVIANIAPLWIAAYPLGEGVVPKGIHAYGCGFNAPRTGVWNSAVIWQFTDALFVPGYKGDASVTTPAWMKANGLGAVLVSPPTKSQPASPIYTEPSTGPAVVLIQKTLAKFHLYPSNKIDGAFGQATLYGVMLLQHKLGLPAAQCDGMWGPTTIRALAAYEAAHAPVTSSTVNVPIPQPVPSSGSPWGLYLVICFAVLSIAIPTLYRRKK